MDEQYHPRLHDGCNYSSMLGLKLIHVSKGGLCTPMSRHKKNTRVALMPTLASLVVLEVFLMTTSSATSDDKWHHVNFLVSTKCIILEQNQHTGSINLASQHNQRDYIILCMHPTNERWCYSATPPLIGWAYTENDTFIGNTISLAEWQSLLRCDEQKSLLQSYGFLILASLTSWTNQRTGPHLNIKTVLSTYGDFHVKDKTAVRTSYL